jgi:hypothetical protein
MWRALIPRPAAEHQALLERSLELVRTADAVILSDYAKGALSAAALPGGHRPGPGATHPGIGRSQGAGLQQICRRHHHLP